MSNYRDFIQDFPVRCGEILDNYMDQARHNGREVTHLFAIAAAALPIPFERLRKPSGGMKHPSRDKDRYEKAAGKFANLSDKEFLTSELWGGDIRSWEIGYIMPDQLNKTPEVWSSSNTALPKSIKVIEILEHFRNALAHGSIFTLPDTEDNINRIIFLSEHRDAGRPTGQYILISSTPDDFTLFLVKWIKFLKDLNLTPI